jgi:hypothetical protein
MLRKLTNKLLSEAAGDAFNSGNGSLFRLCVGTSQSAAMQGQVGIGRHWHGGLTFGRIRAAIKI